MKKQVIVEDYNPLWPLYFESFRKVYAQYAGDYLLSIEHVGSTSVPGLAAKPIIDIDIIVADEKNKNKVIQTLATLGYIHQGDLGIKGREAFKKESIKTPKDGSNQNWPDHHLYVCIEGIPSLENHIKLRNYLRKHPNEAQIYGQLKKDLAQKFPYDIDQYIENKSPFINRILALTGIKLEDIQDINQQNKRE